MNNWMNFDRDVHYNLLKQDKKMFTKQIRTSGCVVARIEIFFFSKNVYWLHEYNNNILILTYR